MEGSPLISVLIPAFNVEKYIEKSIHSILSQTESNVEVLVYDDASGDNTASIVSRIRNPKVKLFEGDRNRGVVFVRNFLLRQARGEFIAFQDGDDWSVPDRLEAQMNFLRAHPDIGCCGTQFVKIVDDKAVYHSDFPCDAASIKRDIPGVFHFLPASVMLRRSLLDDIGMYDPFFANDGNEDLYLISKIALMHGMGNIDAHAYCYNLNLLSLSKLGSLSTRKLYIHEITASLLRDLIVSGTNVLERCDKERLALLERHHAEKHQHLGRFDVFENVIGQLLHYRQYLLAAKQIVQYFMQYGNVIASGRLLAYVITRLIRDEG